MSARTRVLTVLLLGASLPAATLAGAVRPAAGQAISGDAFGIGLISEERTKAEESVRQLRGQRSSRPQAYAEGRRLYTEAQAGFNRYVDRLKFALVAGENLSRPQAEGDYRRALDAAADRNARFIAHVETNAGQGVRGGIVGEIAEAFIQGGVAIWKEWARQSQAQRQQILDALEALKFKSFDEVK